MRKVFLFLFFFNYVQLLAQSDTTVSIIVSSNYINANIIIDGIETGLTTPAVIHGVQTGSHKIKLSWNYLVTGTEYAAEEIVDVKRDRDSFYVEFKPVTVGIVCNAQKTELYLNGFLKGNGSDIVLDSIIPGTYTMHIKQPFGIIAEKKVYFAPNSSDCPVECFVFGNLHVTSDEIDNVPVFLNGKITDQSVPAVFTKLLVGEYEASVKVKGEIFSKKIIVKPDEDVYVTINPKQIDRESREQKAINDSLYKAQKKALAAKKRQDELNKEQNTINSNVNEYYRSKMNVILGGNYSYVNTKNSEEDGVGVNVGFGYDYPIRKFALFQCEISYANKSIKRMDETNTINMISLSLNLKKYFTGLLYLKGGIEFEKFLNYKKWPFFYEESQPGEDFFFKTYPNKYFINYHFNIGVHFSKRFYGEISFSTSLQKFCVKAKDYNKKFHTLYMNYGYSIYLFGQ